MSFITQGKTNWKFILVVFILAVIAGGGVLLYFQKSEQPISFIDSSKTEQKSEQEQGCVHSGGTIATSSCCKSASDFPNTCLVGACGCSPMESHQVKICDCGINKCFNGKECLGSQVDSSSEISFETIAKGSYAGGNMVEKNYIVSDNNDWKNLWDKVNSNSYPPELLPEVDFNGESILAVFYGGKASGGFAIEINKVVETENSLEVFIKKTSPGAGCVVTMSITSPYHIVKVKKTNKEVIFTTDKEIHNCK